MTRSRKIKIETFTIFQDDGHRQIFLEIGPRYNPPLDDTAVLRVGHKTTDTGGVSVLLEGADFKALYLALLSGHPWRKVDLQTSAELGPAARSLAIRWNGSGRSRTFTFDPAQWDEITGWMADRMMWGWNGWKSGLSAEAQAEESARTEDGGRS